MAINSHLFSTSPITALLIPTSFLDPRHKSFSNFTLGDPPETWCQEVASLTAAALLPALPQLHPMADGAQDHYPMLIPEYSSQGGDRILGLYISGGRDKPPSQNEYHTPW